MAPCPRNNQVGFQDRTKSGAVQTGAESQGATLGSAPAGCRLCWKEVRPLGGVREHFWEQALS